ncbi:MAG: sigma-70 family RNA polymerase sigma factor [Dehalococcoidia bacterium]
MQGHDQAATGRDDPEALARRAVARDPETWGAIFEANWHGVYAFLRFRLSGAAEAEDLAAQVFEIAYTRAESFDYRGVPIEGWLIGIARNLLRDQYKKLARRGYQEELVETMTPPEPDAAPSVDLRADLLLAMKSLTEDQQTVLTLRFLLDKSVEETSRHMERSEDAVKNLQRRALGAMARALQGTAYAFGGGL